VNRAFPIGLLAAAALLAAPAAASGQGGKPVVVEPGDLTKRPDLIGKEVIVDDRGGFQYHNETRSFDEINLRRAPDVTFRLPKRLWVRQSPQGATVKVQGVLRRDGGGWWVDVTAYEALPSDLERLNRAVALLDKSDVEARSAWARWAVHRAEEFARLARRHDPARADKEDALLARAREVVGEVIRYQSEHPPARGQAAFWLDLASKARTEGVAEPEPSAQAHQGFRAALGSSKSADELDDLVKKIEAFFPDAPQAPTGPPDLAKWEKPYANAPADAYRSASDEGRKALDHRLWADATVQRLNRRAADDPKSVLGLAEEAARLLPDRPEVATSLFEKGLADATGDVGKLRQAEVAALATLYRDKLRQPERAAELYRAWLDDQKNHRLSPRDAEGRITLAEQYETLVDDPKTAESLLRDAWKIDPGSREVADAFRRRGFKKVNDEWVKIARAKGGEPKEPPAAGPDAPGPEPAPVAVVTPPAAAAPSDSLRNATPAEVVSRLNGKPNRRTRVVSRGLVTEQWVYVQPKQLLYVNFSRRPSDTRPHVVSYYSLPLSGVGSLTPP